MTDPRYKEGDLILQADGWKILIRDEYDAKIANAAHTQARREVEAEINEAAATLTDYQWGFLTLTDSSCRIPGRSRETSNDGEAVAPTFVAALIESGRRNVAKQYAQDVRSEMLKIGGPAYCAKCKVAHPMGIHTNPAAAKAHLSNLSEGGEA